MNYKETLFFVGKCLTISHEEHNKILVEKAIKSGNVDWDNVVKLSTAHYVFPALFCNLKRADFLQFLPEELVNYMKHITDLNRERNLQIIKQAKEINELLLANNITPIFLKGTGNLLSGLYKDVAERMVGDIDFLVAPNDFEKTISLLENNHYSKVHKTKYDFPSFKHHPRLQKENNIAAIEIHKELIIEKFANEFNYNHVTTNLLEFNNSTVLSLNNQLALAIIAFQINDSGFLYNKISFRNAYDVLLFSKKTKTKSAIENYNLLFNPLNYFLAICSITLNSNSIHYSNNKKTKKYILTFDKIISNPKYFIKRQKNIDRKLFLRQRLSIILKAFYKKEYRIWLFKKITDKEWLKEKAIQLKVKSSS